jgi:hypothetical protein
MHNKSETILFKYILNSEHGNDKSIPGINLAPCQEIVSRVNGGIVPSILNLGTTIKLD